MCATCGTRNPVPQTVAAIPAPERQAGASTAVLDRRSGSHVADYRLQEILGQGGMGMVYDACSASGEAVAVKLLRPGLRDRPDFVSRFQREARAASRLDHPNIVRVLDYGFDESGVPYLVMERLEGSDLLAVIRQRNLGEKEAVEWMLQTASGLQAATEQSITHRDIKPTNLFLTTRGQIKIADFGLAKAADTESHLTITGEVLGTPHYMSPEQGQGARVDFRSDLYSLGATFYHLLAGAPPFTADTPVAVIMKHLREEPVPLRRLRPELTPAFESIIHRLLQKAPNQRYRSYADLIADLRRIERGEAPRHGAAPPVRRIQDGRTTYLLPEEQPTQLLLRKAGTLRRAIAFLVDVAMIELVVRAGLWLAIQVLLLTAAPGDALRLHPAALHRPAVGILTLAFAIFYFLAADSTGGRSFGKNRMRLRICRKNGKDLGPARAFLRTLLTLPGVALISPALASACLPWLEPLVHWTPNLEQAQVAGLLYLTALWVLGRVGSGQTTLQDWIAGAQVYRAEPAQRRSEPFRRPASSRRTAMLLSVIPGLGLISVGRLWLGLATPILMVVVRDSGTLIVGIWAASALLAGEVAQRRALRLQSQRAGLAPDDVVRRQES